VTTIASVATTIARSATVTTLGTAGAVTATTSVSSALVTVRPGSFCAPEGALGTYNSVIYVCSKTDVNGVPYSGNRARWRRQA
jgi:cytochrome c5